MQKRLTFRNSLEIPASDPEQGIGRKRNGDNKALAKTPKRERRYSEPGKRSTTQHDKENVGANVALRNTTTPARNRNNRRAIHLFPVCISSTNRDQSSVHDSSNHPVSNSIKSALNFHNIFLKICSKVYVKTRRLTGCICLQSLGRIEAQSFHRHFDFSRHFQICWAIHITETRFEISLR